MKGAMRMALALTTQRRLIRCRQEHALAFMRAIEYRLGSAEESSA